jgi:hypothetical protein
MARARTTKKLAQRIDLQYFRRPTAFRRARFWLSILLPAAAVAWIAWHGFTADSRVYSSGQMSRSHAVLEKQCAACHLMKAGAYSAKVQNTACLACHDGPVHHESQGFTPDCAACHVEHRGAVPLAATASRSCAECHASLRTRTGATRFAAKIETFEDGHPEFAVLRERRQDPGTIKLNHAVHMKPIRRGPGGPIVQLDCADCHRPEAVRAEWPYGDAHYIAAKASYAPSELAPRESGALRPLRPPSGREFMAPPKFATACAACHLLEFDKRFSEGVPHDKPEVVHAFVVKKFQEHIAAHPAESRVLREPDRNLTGKPLAPAARVLTPAQWVQEKTAEAEELLWRKTCKQCHALDFAPGASLPCVAEARITARWMPHARFDHDAHRGFSCTSCHQAATRSTETTDVLLPGIATCKTCHGSGEGHAESRCYECHTYHDWSKRKEVKPTFTLPSLAAGGR